MPEKSSYGFESIRVLLAGGGSGGHTYPLLAVAERLRKIAAEERVNLGLDYLGPKDVWAKALLPAHVNLKTIVSSKFRRYFSIENLLDIPKFFIGLLEAFFKVYFIMPDVIFSKGGTGALPVVIAGWFYKIPIIIHESDAAPGLTNSISSRFASRIAVSFPKTLEYFSPDKTALVGTPVRESVITEIPDKATAKKSFGFDPAKPLILIMGGSQGAQRINEFVIANLPALLKETQILHQTGEANYAKVEYLSRTVSGEEPAKNVKKSYVPVPYFREEMKTALAAADVVISRSGSGTIAEISALGKPSILIPLKESANDHQRLNAYEYAKTGAAIVIEEANLLPAILINQISLIIEKSDISKKMSLAASGLWKPDAAETISREILRLG